MPITCGADLITAVTHSKGVNPLSDTLTNPFGLTLNTLLVNFAPNLSSEFVEGVDAGRIEFD